MSGLVECFADQSHIAKVRDALQVLPVSRASVMIGSGFSKNAEQLPFATSAMPGWADVATSLYIALYPEDSGNKTIEGLSSEYSAQNVLRLAQEYKSAFGRSDLHNLLGDLLRDADFRPGQLHLRLLQLPWRDVFTTNWDTLLERANPVITERPYTVVQSIDQLPMASQPRIIKMHGSFPMQLPLIVTEEDYRTYPREFAPFVNTVQQAMMETTFLLIGFSGDDPNFLNWLSWVRENLGDSAPKIYLAGWLGLSQHRRRMLEDGGVVPIDLARHPKAHIWPESERHRFATEWLILTLEQSVSYDITTWPTPPSEPKIEVPEHLEPVLRPKRAVPRPEPRAT